MIDLIRKKFDGKKVLLLGFGREGQSTYNLFRKALPDSAVTIADGNEEIEQNPILETDSLVTFQTGEGYLSGLEKFDLIIKSPGITLKDIETPVLAGKITSQTALLLEGFREQIIGITGTKGKSTTSTLLQFVLRRAGKNAVLLGNIGRPAFNCLEDIKPGTHIVFEMSSHQLEHVSVSPHIAVLLNIYQEHLDAYRSYQDYQLSKMNIAKFQKKLDFFIYNADDENIAGLVQELAPAAFCLPNSFKTIPESGCFVRDGWIQFKKGEITEQIYDLKWKRKIKGDHNLRNIMAVISVCRILGIEKEDIIEGIAAFTGLEHRMEFVGEYNGILFYNDSIATIPEATIEAVKALEKVDTLILGGFDRGIDYTGLAKFLPASGVRNLILTGEAGKRIREEIEKSGFQCMNCFSINRFDDFVPIAFQATKRGSICILSPAAASYDEFVNFEQRGKRFKDLLSVFASSR